MRTRQRLLGLKKWFDEKLCEGRELKAPGPNMAISGISYQKPKVFLAWRPTRDDARKMEEAIVSHCPSILIMPNVSKVKDTEEHRFDRYSNIHRSKELGQTLSVSILFAVYEPGIMMPGFLDSRDDQSGYDMTLFGEGTEEGLFTLTDWMDDCIEELLAAKAIPGTDLFVIEESAVYSLYSDQNYVVDRRPVYYGYINVEFGCYANEGQNSAVNALLE